MEIVDKSGTPRSTIELIEARVVIEMELIRSVAPITIYYPTIIEALNELIERRKREQT